MVEFWLNFWSKNRSFWSKIEKLFFEICSISKLLTCAHFRWIPAAKFPSQICHGLIAHRPMVLIEFVYMLATALISPTSESRRSCTMFTLSFIAPRSKLALRLLKYYYSTWLLLKMSSVLFILELFWSKFDSFFDQKNGFLNQMIKLSQSSEIQDSKKLLLSPQRPFSLNRTSNYWSNFASKTRFFDQKMVNNFWSKKS